MTDEELMVAYKEGDLSAFQILYKRHKGRLMGYLIPLIFQDVTNPRPVGQPMECRLVCRHFR